MTAYQCEDYVITCDGCGDVLTANGIPVHYDNASQSMRVWEHGWAATDDERHLCPPCRPAERDASDVYHERLENRTR